MAAKSETNVFGARLRSARIMKKMSMDDLIEQMGDARVTRAAISKFENGIILPSAETRSAIAKALGLALSYFDQPLISAIEDCKMDFRKKASMKAADVNALKEKVKDKVRRYMEIEQILSRSIMPPHNDVLPHSGLISTVAGAKNFAQTVRETWKLGVAPIQNVQQELERHGVMVIPVVESDDFDGLSGKIDDNKIFVVVNATKDHVERRRLTVMHEVGHQLMTFDNNMDARTQEKLCHVFANEMLAPESAFRTWLANEPKINLASLRPLQMFYGISIDALMKKAEECGFISTKEFANYNVYKNMNQGFKESVQASKYVESPIVDRFSSLVLRALSMELISKDEALRFLHDSDQERRDEVSLL